MGLQDISILIVEDDFSFALELEMLVKEIGYSVMGTVDNSAEALEVILSKEPDLILMDIDIKGNMTGLEIAEKITHLSSVVLFLSSIKQQAVYDRAQHTNFLGYMVKPIDAFSLRSSVEMAIRHLLPKTEEAKKLANVFSSTKDLFFKTKGIFKKINIEQINFIEADGNYTLTHTSKDKFVTSLTLVELEAILQSHQFLKVHRSYLVNLKKIEYLDIINNRIIIEGNQIPVSRANKATLLEKIQLLQ